VWRVCITPYPGTYPFAYPIPCPGGYEGMGYGTSKYMYTSSICVYCMHMHMFTREEHAVVPCEPTTTSPLTVRHLLRARALSTLLTHCLYYAKRCRNSVSSAKNGQKFSPTARSPPTDQPSIGVGPGESRYPSNLYSNGGRCHARPLGN